MLFYFPRSLSSRGCPRDFVRATGTFLRGWSSCEVLRAEEGSPLSGLARALSWPPPRVLPRCPRESSLGLLTSLASLPLRVRVLPRSLHESCLAVSSRGLLRAGGTGRAMANASAPGAAGNGSSWPCEGCQPRTPFPEFLHLKPCGPATARRRHRIAGTLEGRGWKLLEGGGDFLKSQVDFFRKSLPKAGRGEAERGSEASELLWL